MDSLTSLFEQIFTDSENVILLLIMLATVAIVMTIGFAFSALNSPLKKRIKILQGENVKETKKNTKVSETLESLSPYIAPTSQKEKETIRTQLMHAGFHQASTLNVFYAIKLFSALTGLIFSGLAYLYLANTSYLLIGMMVPLALGVFAPNIVLSRLISNRQDKINQGVPDALDLLVVCTESGLGFNAGLKRIADELVISHPELADELDTVCAKIQAGVEMPTALSELVDRTGIYELKGLVSMLGHASRIGGSLADTLRAYTEDYRDKRNQAAEEVAAKIPTKMLFPMILFIWPCFFIVAVGPALLMLLDALK
ncbi:type II secretion system F family protein [Vibrio breoganii]|uniref:type II secretion system F family protein n=1 Tax=Vibrio breoganii TaxID=553239 RepID=UPI000C81560A|nr:type II secretion system F family protein [Vibrio breoganii]PMK46243.1 pilus assembly protein TadC [Vibrio breoganii]PMO51313.1 pilus assembly protein TadC [Vibrio breoganii]